MNQSNAIITKVTKALNSTPNGVTFFGIKNYTNSYGEVSNVVINIGASFDNAKKKDIVYLESLDVNTIINSDIDKTLLEQARTALLQSLVNPNENRSNAQIDAYTRINNAIKVHNENGTIYIFGFSVNKEVLVEGVYPIVNSRPLTIAKQAIQKGMKSTKYRMYKVETQPENITLSGNSETMIIQVS